MALPQLTCPFQQYCYLAPGVTNVCIEPRRITVHVLQKARLGFACLSDIPNSVLQVIDQGVDDPSSQ